MAAVVAVMAVAGFLAFHREIPSWRMDGTASVAMPLVGYDAGVSLCPLPGETFVLRGDSLVAGARMGPDGTPYGKVAAREMGHGIAGVLQGDGGATAASGAERRAATRPEGRVVLLAYGTNDAAVRGMLGGKEAAPLHEFRQSLTGHVLAARQHGSLVGLLAPPPVGSPAMAGRIQPYRKMVEQVGRETGTTVLDPAEAFASCADSEPLLGKDALHINATGHQCIGRWLAKRLCDIPSE